MQKTPRPRRDYTPEQKKEFIDKWKNSSLSKSVFCQQHELTQSAFHRWLTKTTYPKTLIPFHKNSQATSYSSSQISEKPCCAKKNKYRMLRYYTFEQWKGFVEEWQNSGLSKNEYCRQKDLAPRTFSSWSKKLSDPELAKIASMQYRPFYTPNQWKEMVEERKKSGLSLVAYCMKKGVTTSSLNRWEQTFKYAESFKEVSECSQKSKETLISSFEKNFIPVTLKPSSLVNTSNAHQKVEVILSQGHHLSIQGPFEWEGLISLLTSLLRS